MSYPADKYRALGVGETVHTEHYYWDELNQISSPVNLALHGHILDGTEEFAYLELLPVKDVFPSGAVRSANEGRGRFDLVPFEAMLSLARRYEMGAKQFGDRNWERGQPLSRLLSSMRRHAHQINYDFSEDHVGAVLWNAAAFVTMVARIEAGILPKELDDIGYFMNAGASKQ